MAIDTVLPNRLLH